MGPASRIKTHPLDLALLGALAAAWGARFIVPGIGASGGAWPVPLDDTYIHFDFARSWATGHPFEWIAGQGYSSGETAPLYAVVLAVGYAAGFREQTLALFGALVAAVSFVSVVRSLASIIQPTPRWVVAVLGALIVSVGWIGWVWWSGMEVALFGACAARALASTGRARGDLAPGERRANLGWRVGVWSAAMVLLRPEAIVIAPWLAVVCGRGAKARSGFAQAGRALSLPMGATLAVSALNWTKTGGFLSAGAELKLLSANPFLTELDRARETLLNVLHFKWKVIDSELGLLAPIGLALVGIALVHKRTRALAWACCGAAVCYAALSSLNGVARYQGFRYYAPAALLVLFACCLGVGVVARLGRLGPVAALAALIAAGSAWRASQSEVFFFSRAAADIEGLQVEVGRRIAWRTKETDLVLVGDAGAIPYVSRRRAVDALGLGGYLGVPFARAAPHGEGAMLELLERIPADLRPTHMALFPNWFPETTSRFCREIDRVTIDAPTIAGGRVKVICAADFGPFATPSDPAPMPDGAPTCGPIIAELDVADVISEGAAKYMYPAPNGGWVATDVRHEWSGARRFDAARIIPQGRSESFLTGVTGSVLVVARVGDGIEEAVLDGGASLTFTPPRPHHWRYGWARIDAPPRLTVTAARGELRSFHYWLRRCD